MAVRIAEKQARWRERHPDSSDGTKTLQFIFDAGGSAQLMRVSAHKGCSVAALVREWAAKAERRITGHALRQGAEGLPRWRERVATNEHGY
jgi:hypothetical protein